MPVTVEQDKDLKRAYEALQGKQKEYELWGTFRSILWYNECTTIYKKDAPAVLVTPWSVRQPVRRSSMSHHITPLDSPQSRSCRKCGETKPLSEFGMARSPHGKRDLYHRHVCKQCTHARQNDWRRQKAIDREHETPDSKTCPGCNQEKESGEFGISKRERDGLQTYCNDCRREHYEANKEHVVARVIQWQRDNMDRHKEKQERWKQRNPERAARIAATSRNNRRLRMIEAGGSFTEQEWHDLCEKYDFRCLACGKRKRLSIDHVVPVSKGGSNDISNIQPLCRSCNSKKHATIIDYRIAWGGTNAGHD